MCLTVLGVSTFFFVGFLCLRGHGNHSEQPLECVCCYAAAKRESPCEPFLKLCVRLCLGTIVFLNAPGILIFSGGSSEVLRGLGWPETCVFCCSRSWPAGPRPFPQSLRGSGDPVEWPTKNHFVSACLRSHCEVSNGFVYELMGLPRWQSAPELLREVLGQAAATRIRPRRCCFGFARPPRRGKRLLSRWLVMRSGA